MPTAQSCAGPRSDLSGSRTLVGRSTSIGSPSSCPPPPTPYDEPPVSIQVTSLPDAKPRPRHVAVGTFDGVHRGHQAVIEGADTVLTFHPHPLEVLHPAAMPKLIMPFGVKRDVIEGLGVDELVVIPFDREFSQRSAEEFVEGVLIETLGAEQVSVGENFRFGAKAKGDPAMLS